MWRQRNTVKCITWNSTEIPSYMEQIYWRSWWSHDKGKFMELCEKNHTLPLFSWYWMQSILMYSLYMGQRDRIDNFLLRYSLILSSLRGYRPYPWWHVINMISLWSWCLSGLIDSNNILSHLSCLYLSYFDIKPNPMVTGWYRDKLTRREYIV